MRMHALTVLAIVTGCVHAPRLVSLGSEPYTFWPPPRATSVVESTGVAASTTMGESAAAVAASLREDGYTDVRWYPVGGHYEHGFAVTTRLERVDSPSEERWPATYPDPVEPRWLESAAPPPPTNVRVRVHARALAPMPLT